MRSYFIIIVALLTIPMVLRRPLWGLAIYLGFNVVRPEMLFWGDTQGSFIFMFYYVLTLVSAFVNGYFARIRMALHKELLLLLWMISAIYLSIYFTQYQVSMNYYFALELVKTFGTCTLIYILITSFLEIKFIQTVLLNCVSFLAIWGIQQNFLGNERLEGLGGYAFGDSNSVASVFVLFLPIALARAYCSGKRRDKWISLVMAVIIVAVIVCTKSRGGFLGLLTALFSFGFYARKTTSVIKIAVVLALFAAPFATESYFERLNTMTTTDTENVEGSARSRLILWKAGLMVFIDNPFLGSGFMTYPQAKMKYEGDFLYLEDSFREWVFRKEDKKVTHNTYIQMLSDCGLVGGIPFLWLIVSGIRAGFRARGKLLKRSDKNTQLLWLCGICAGFNGFSVCMITIDSVALIFIYVQLVFIGILSRMLNVSDGCKFYNGQAVTTAGVQEECV